MWVRSTALSVFILLLTAYGVLLAYSLPRTLKVYVTGAKSQSGSSSSFGEVRQIQALSLEGESLRFRNENTGWGFPPYFKFNAEELGAQARELAKIEPRVVVRVRAQGFRLGDSLTTPNLISLKVVPLHSKELPLFNWGVLALHVVGAGVLFATRRQRAIRRAEQDEEEWEDETPEPGSVSLD